MQKKKTAFFLTLASVRKYSEVPQTPFSLGPTQQCEREAGSPTGKFV